MPYLPPFFLIIVNSNKLKKAQCSVYGTYCQHFFSICCATKIPNPGLDIALFVSIFESAHMTHGQPISELKPAKRGEYFCFFFDPFFIRRCVVVIYI